MQPPLPEYAKLPDSVNTLMARNLKAWAYTVSICGDSVNVHDKRNVAKARQIIMDAGLAPEVEVRYFPF